MKKTVFLLLNILSMFAQGVWAQGTEEPTAVTSGTCGDCTWSFDADKQVMTISPVAGGTGRMADFPDIMEAIEQDGSIDPETQSELFKRPWGDFNPEIKQLIIEDGVTYISDWSFIMIAIEEVVIPNTVTEIGSGAFMGDFYLKKVVIGEGVETIGDLAFYFTRPEEFIVGSNVKHVGKAALGVRERTIVTCLGPAFEDWDEYDEDIDAKATIYISKQHYPGWIEKYPLLVDNFRYNASESEWHSGDCLVKLNTDNTMTVSGTGAMADYASIDDVPWKDDRTMVRKVTFESGVTKIGKNAFAGFTSALNVEFDGDQLTWEGSATDFSEGTTFHFNKDGRWLDIFPALLNRSYEIACGGGLFWNYDKTNKVLNFYKKVFEDPGEMNDYGNTDETRASWYPLREVVDTVKFAHGLKYIGAYAFNNFINLKTVDMPSSLVNCGEAAFQYTSIERFEFPATMKNIPARIFNTAHLTEVILPEGVETIGEKAFQFCSHLEKLYLPRTLKTISANAFNLAFDDFDVYVTSAKPSDITWTSESTDFGPNTRFHVLSGMTSIWKAAHPNALVQYVEMTYTEDNPYEVRTIADWRHLRDMVNNGARPIYAKMMNDINMGNTSDFLGTKEHPFNGVFDGQGYTWNGNFDNWRYGNDYRAPFRHIEGATIRNLRITGLQRNYESTATFMSSKNGGYYARIYGSRWCGGIVGRAIGKDNIIESCTMSGEFRYGDWTNGGIVGEVAPEATVDIRNTLFDGRLEVGEPGYYHDGLCIYNDYYTERYQRKPGKSSPFVGQNNGGTLNMVNCFFSGSIDTKGYKNDNLVVGETVSGGTNNIENVYYIFTGEETDAPESTTNAKEMTVRQLDNSLGAMWQMNGETTVKPYPVVEDFEGEGTSAKPYLISSEDKWRQLIYLSDFYPKYNGKMWKQTADITTTKWGALLNGTELTSPASYDGDQHTLTLDIETVKSFAAPFAMVDNSSVKNLKVAGSIKGGIHTAGLISRSYQYAEVENCLVDADITFGGNSVNNAHGGGIIGHCTNGPVHLTDCVFTGKLTAVDNGKSDATCAGTIVGWGDAEAKIRLNNCFDVGECSNVQDIGLYCIYNNSESTDRTLENCYYVNGQTPDATKVTRIGDKDALKDVTSSTQTTHTRYIMLDIDLYREGSTPLCYLTCGDNTYITYGLLFNDADNKNLIETYKGEANDLTIYGRTLYKDGTWNTLCLPFPISQEQLQADDCPLKGVTIKTLESSSFKEETGTLKLTFRNDNSIQANTPYIIKWNKPTDVNESSVVVNPTFKGVSIEEPDMPGMLPHVDAGDVQFIGRFAPYALKANDRKTLYMGPDNKLYYPTADMTIGAFRCYFKMPFLTAGDPNEEVSVKGFVLDFGDGETTSIDEELRMKDEESADAWYSLDGRRLSDKPTTRGVYINNGKKIVIK